jgi:ArsR family transcriptional regulator, arsenate/arsenite/antimonite-responsive transcriptional repressor
VNGWANPSLTRRSGKRQNLQLCILTIIYVLCRLMIVDMKNGTQAAQWSDKFKALADPNRLRILEMLRHPSCCSVDKDAGMCACDIESQLDLSQPTISHHMKVLRDAGLVEAEKIGQWMFYKRNEKALKELARVLNESS